MKRNKNCTRCAFHVAARNVCMKGDGNPNATLLICGEAPGFTEDMQGRPFIGQAGQLLDHVLEKLGIIREGLWITNCFRCRPPNNKLPGKKDTDQCFEMCWPYLKQEIEDVDPKAILLLGGTPLKLLVGPSQITKYECMEVDTIYDEARTFAAFHPAYVLRSPSKEVRLAQAIARAAKVAGIKIKTSGWEEGGMYEYEIRE